MPGGDALGAEVRRVLQEGLELDLPVAQDVGIRRAPGPVLGEELLEYESQYSAAKLRRCSSMPSRSATACASAASAAAVQRQPTPGRSSSSQFFMNMPAMARPCCCSKRAETDESTPPDMATMITPELLRGPSMLH
jgi:hypothetical protein